MPAPRSRYLQQAEGREPNRPLRAEALERPRGVLKPFDPRTFAGRRGRTRRLGADTILSRGTPAAEHLRLAGLHQQHLKPQTFSRGNRDSRKESLMPQRPLGSHGPLY